MFNYHRIDFLVGLSTLFLLFFREFVTHNILFADFVKILEWYQLLSTNLGVLLNGLIFRQLAFA